MLTFYQCSLVFLQSGADFTGLLCVLSAFVIPGIILTVVLVILNKNNKAIMRAREQELRQVHSAYNQSLDRLRKDPANSALREDALYRGRKYLSVARRGPVTVFDGVAISNTINAICAGGFIAPQPPPPVPVQNKSIEERLRQLGDLRKAGLIDDAEYTFRKASIIDEI